MKLLIFLLVCVFSLEPACEALRRQTLKKAVGSNESYVLNLEEHFQGNNLNFTVSTSRQANYFVVQRTEEIERKQHPQPFQQMVDFDILLDQNGVGWDRQAALLTGSNEIAFGYLSTTYNIQFGQAITITDDENIECLQVTMLEQNKAIADCKKYNETTKEAKNILIFVENDPQTEPIPFEFDSISNPSDRITLLYRTDQNSFLLSATISKNTTFQNQSYITIYSINEDQVTFVNIVDSTTFSAGLLSIEDMEVDTNNNVLIADKHYGLRSFKYYSSNRIQVGLKFKAENSYSVAASPQFTTGSNIALLGTADGLIELNYDTEIIHVKEYDLDVDFSQNPEIQSNSQIFTIRTDFSCLLFRLHSEYLIAQIKFSNISFTNLLKISNNLLLVQQNSSSVHFISQGYLIIDRLPADDTVQIQAKSQTDEGTKTCNITMEVLSTNNTQEIIQIGKIPQKIRVSSPSTLDHFVWDLVSGGRLSLQSVGTEQIQYKLEYLQDIIASPTWESAVHISSFPYEQKSFLQFVKMKPNYGINVQQCSINHIVSCTTKVLFGLFDQILFDGLWQLKYYLYVVQKEPNVLKVWEMPNWQQGQTEGNAYFSLTFNGSISHLSADQFIFVTIAQNFVVHLVSLNSEQNKFEITTSISRSNFTIEQLAIFRPKMAIPCLERYLCIKNINSVVFVQLFYDEAIFVSQLKCNKGDTQGWDWQPLIGTESLVFVEANTTNWIVEEYNLVNVIRPVRVKSIEMFNQSVTMGQFQLKSSLEDIAVIKSTIDSENRLTIIRLGVGQLNSNLHSIVVDSNTILATYSNENGTLVQFTYPNKSIGSVFVHRQPKLAIQIFQNSTQWRLQESLDFNISNPTTTVQVKSNLQVLNDLPVLSVGTKSNNKMFLPRTAADLVKSLDSRSLFNGVIQELQIECPMCDQEIQLISYFQESGESAVADANQYMYFQEEQLTWTLTDDQIYVRDSDGNFIGKIELGIGQDICYNWQQYNLSLLILICQSQNEAYFLPVNISIDKKSGKPVYPHIPISSQFTPQNAITMKISGNRLFILDNDIEGQGNGVLYIFRIVDRITVIADTIVTALNFTDDPESLIQDIDILKPQVLEEQSRQILLLSLSEFRLAYSLYDPSLNASFKLEDIHSVELEDYARLSEYTIDDNELLQIQLLGSVSYLNKTDIVIQSRVFVSTAYSQHLLLQMNISLDQTYKVKNTNVALVKALRSYGGLDCFNWAESDNKNQIILAYYDGELVHLVWYNLSGETTYEPQWFIAGYSTEFDPEDDVTFAGRLFHDADGQLHLLSNLDSEEDLHIQLHNKTSLVFNYHVAGNFSSITLVASNAYFEARQQLPVEFRHPPDESGIKWYVYVLIGCGILAAILVTTGIILRYRQMKKKKEEKESLMESERATQGASGNLFP